MRDYKNIDRIFQENLKDFEVFPPNKSWDAIEKRLSSTPKKKRIPIWVKLSSIAAVLMLLFTVGAIYFIPENNFTKNLMSKIDNPNEIINDKDSVDTNSQNKISPTTKKLQKIDNIKTFKEEKLTNVENKQTELEKETTFNKKTITNNLLADTKNLPLKDINSIESPEKESVKESKFTVATIFAPIYFNSFGDGSGIDEQFKNNPTSISSSYSYGVKFAYQITNKFSLQSGVNLINLGYKTNNVYVTPGVAVVGFSNLSTNPVVARTENAKSSQAANSNLVEDNVGSLNQVFGYIEIPVEIKYSVTDGKLGVNLVGGFSTLLLNRDEVFIETNSFSQSLGSSNNLRDLNFSGNIGIDIDYSIKKNFYINISPMFKVQTNTFSKNSGSFQPYYLGVYTGLNYKF
ncbi:outer membrane beta-barrel protein [Lutibacter sp. B1]|uniref:outer membrane beta-barrel protein n=1 Tax=Lutibacter sp. B1 TaxID=2725996 RepID=UPI0014574B2E|nr:PorT family protein [Lutibacter sp. B1]